MQNTVLLGQVKLSKRLYKDWDSVTRSISTELITYMQARTNKTIVKWIFKDDKNYWITECYRVIEEDE